jgi:hypothetical protein
MLFANYLGTASDKPSSLEQVPKLSDGTLARLGHNEGVRKMQTAERAASGRLAGLRKPYHEPRRARVPDRPAGIEAI